MDVFDFRKRLIDEYGAYINSFINVQEPRAARSIQAKVNAQAKKAGGRAADIASKAM